MSTSCNVVVTGRTGHWRYEVRCGKKVVACGSRSTRALAETAGARELAVYGSVSSGRRSGGGGANLIPAMPGSHGRFGTIPTLDDVVMGGGGAKARAGGFYAIVAFGDPDRTVKARFPHATVGTLDECEDALARWRQRAGWLAGSAEGACSVRVKGPYASRALARRADISR